MPDLKGAQKQCGQSVGGRGAYTDDTCRSAEPRQMLLEMRNQL